MAVAAESLHWMDWNVVIPKLAPVLEPGAFLVLVERDLLHPPPWDAELHTLIPAYSTNQEFRPYDLVGEVTTRRLFREAGRRTTSAVPFAQSIDDHVEAMHSRNGFSRERMTAESAAEFDACYRSLLQRHYPDGVVQLATVARVIWGTPVAPTSAA